MPMALGRMTFPIEEPYVAPEDLEVCMDSILEETLDYVLDMIPGVPRLDRRCLDGIFHDAALAMAAST